MLQHLKITFEGRPHCGLDDARNIARLVICMISDGASLRVNEQIDLSVKPRFLKPDQKQRTVIPISRREHDHMKRMEYKRGKTSTGQYSDSAESETENIPLRNGC